uniref:Endonuclease/exonuclease/phosphatase family protein n=1 Tax=Melittangium lichenicola TaxID=45 RepID=A0A3Q8I9N3_9BACT|nr:endonuclease/exonuclease/phosphatase family protein [Melittangium lichenicola]
MRIDRLLAGLFLATPLACVSSSSASRPEAAPAASMSQLRSVSAVALEDARNEADLRVMTFNIQSGLQGLDKVADVIREAAPDIVALQEVDVGSLRANGLDQPAVLAERTGLPYSAHFRTTSLFGGDYGVAILSRFPLESVEQHPLPVVTGTEPRTVAHATVKVNGQEVSVYVTHLTRRPFNNAIRIRQSAAIMGLLARDARPKLLMGDMNDTPDSSALRLFKRELMDVFAQRGEGSDITYPLPIIPSLRLDYVLASDRFMPRHSKVLNVRASDHYPVVAELTLLAPVPAPQQFEATPALASSAGGE